MNYEVLKTISQILTYIGLFASSILTWINLHFKTAQDPETGHRKTLTPAGKAARFFLVVSFLLALISAIVQNFADSKLRRAAEQRGTAAIRNALENQHKFYMGELRQQFEGPNGVIPKIGEQTDALKAAEQRLKKVLTLQKQFHVDLTKVSDQQLHEGTARVDLLLGAEPVLFVLAGFTDGMSRGGHSANPQNREKPSQFALSSS